jgi:hypothetical protein
VPACSTSIHITVLPSLKTQKHDQTVKKICHAICLLSMPMIQYVIPSLSLIW